MTTWLKLPWSWPNFRSGLLLVREAISRLGSIQIQSHLEHVETIFLDIFLKRTLGRPCFHKLLNISFFCLNAHAVYTPIFRHSSPSKQYYRLYHFSKRVKWGQTGEINSIEFEHGSSYTSTILKLYFKAIKLEIKRWGQELIRPLSDSNSTSVVNCTLANDSAERNRLLLRLI